MTLDPTQTAPYELGPVNGPPCLVIHGFTGTPWDVRPVGDALAAAGYRVRGIRLPGHGTTPEALLTVSHVDWRTAVKDALLGFGSGSERPPVVVVGLSMGSLLGVWLAATFPERVKALVLLAPALRFQGPLMALLRALRKTRVIERLHPWVSKGSTDLEDDAARAEAPVLARFPTARLRDLFALQDLAHGVMTQVRAPSLVIFAEHDHVVSRAGAEALVEGLRHRAQVDYDVLHEGFHIIPRDRARERVLGRIQTFLEGI